MAEPPTRAPTGAMTDEEVKDTSDSSSRGEKAADDGKNINPATGKPFHDVDGDKIELTEEDCEDELGFAYPTWKKWTILTVCDSANSSMIPACTIARGIDQIIGNLLDPSLHEFQY